MKILIVDDQLIIVERIERIIREKYPEYEISTATGSAEVTALAESGKTFDLVFLDISIGEENGIDIANYLTGRQKDIKTVFISGYPDMVSDVFFSVQPFGFISKPLKSEMIYKYIEAANKAISDSDGTFKCKIRGMDIEIAFNDIMYIENEGKSLLIHLKDGHILRPLGQLEEAEKMLDEAFIRCHKSYIVNSKYVSGYIRQEAAMTDGVKIPVSRSRKEEFESRYLKYRGLK